MLRLPRRSRGDPSLRRKLFCVVPCGLFLVLLFFARMSNARKGFRMPAYEDGSAPRSSARACPAAARDDKKPREARGKIERGGRL